MIHDYDHLFDSADAARHSATNEEIAEERATVEFADNHPETETEIAARITVVPHCAICDRRIVRGEPSTMVAMPTHDGLAHVACANAERTPRPYTIADPRRAARIAADAEIMRREDERDDVYQREIARTAAYDQGFIAEDDL